MNCPHGYFGCMLDKTFYGLLEAKKKMYHQRHQARKDLIESPCCALKTSYQSPCFSKPLLPVRKPGRLEKSHVSVRKSGNGNLLNQLQWNRNELSKVFDILVLLTVPGLGDFRFLPAKSIAGPTTRCLSAECLAGDWLPLSSQLEQRLFCFSRQWWVIMTPELLSQQPAVHVPRFPTFFEPYIWTKLVYLLLCLELQLPGLCCGTRTTIGRHAYVFEGRALNPDLGTETWF